MPSCGKGRFSISVALACALLIVATGPASSEDMAWDKLADGLAVTVWTPGAACDQVPPLYLVKVDPKQFRFAVYHFRAEGLQKPLTLEEWHDRTKAAVLFNAGLFQDDYSYLGMLLKDGRSLGSKRHPQWHGLFVAEPVSGDGRKARVLDLTADAFDPDKPAYREAAQSLMLLDRHGKPRVQRSGKQAQQTVVGEDRSGYILVIMTKGEVPLWDLAVCLRVGFFGLTQAMAMDGGDSSDVLIGSEAVGARPAGEPPAWQALVDGKGQSHIALPTVIGVFPRR